MRKKCCYCQSDRSNLLYKVGKWSIVKCGECELVRTVGKQEVDYQNYHRDLDYDAYEAYFRNIFQKRYQTISNYKIKGKILDIGASTGVLLEIFKNNGWETWGIEPSDSATIAKQKQIKIIKQTFEKAKLPSNYFDIVIMNHTLEHVDDPVAVLNKIYTILKKGGLVYIDVPNFGSLSAEITGKNWKYLLPNEHVHHFTPSTLVKCLQKAGFKVVWNRTWSGIFDVASPLLKFWQTLSGGKKQFFTDLIELPGNIVATVLNRGTSLAAIGKKL